MRSLHLHYDMGGAVVLVMCIMPLSSPMLFGACCVVGRELLFVFVMFPESHFFLGNSPLFERDFRMEGNTHFSNLRSVCPCVDTHMFTATATHACYVYVCRHSFLSISFACVDWGCFACVWLHRIYLRCEIIVTGHSECLRAQGMSNDLMHMSALYFWIVTDWPVKLHMCMNSVWYCLALIGKRRTFAFALNTFIVKWNYWLLLNRMTEL